MQKSYPSKWTQSYFHEDTRALSAKAARSAIWSISRKAGESGIDFITTALIARTLFPEDFGLVGMASLTMGVVRLFMDYGLGSAIIYKKQVDRIDLSTIFWLNLVVSSVLYVACILLSPLAEAYFRNANVGEILKISALNFIIGGIGSVNSTILSKQLRFNSLALSGISAALVRSLVTLTLVMVFRLGYWGIVFGNVGSSLVLTLFGFYFTRWHPLLVFDFQRLKGMFSYGKNLFLQKIFNYFASNIDYFIIGRLLGAEMLGIYKFAYTIPHTILKEFTQAFTGILFPALCQVNDQTERFQRGYLRAIKFISFFSFPAMTGLFCVAEHFITFFYGTRYIDAVVPLKILCFSGMSKSVLGTMGTVFNSKGRPDIELKWNVGVFPVIAGAVYAGAHYGLSGTALAMTLTSYLSFFAAWLSMRLAKIKFTSYLKAMWPAFAGSILVLVIVSLFDTYVIAGRDFSHFAALMMSVAVGAGVYALYLMFFFREDLMELINFAKSGMTHKQPAAGYGDG